MDQRGMDVKEASLDQDQVVQQNGNHSIGEMCLRGGPGVIYMGLVSGDVRESRFTEIFGDGEFKRTECGM